MRGVLLPVTQLRNAARTDPNSYSLFLSLLHSLSVSKHNVGEETKNGGKDE